MKITSLTGKLIITKSYGHGESYENVGVQLDLPESFWIHEGYVLNPEVKHKIEQNQINVKVNFIQEPKFTNFNQEDIDKFRTYLKTLSCKNFIDYLDDDDLQQILYWARMCSTYKTSSEDPEWVAHDLSDVIRGYHLAKSLQS